MAAAAAQNPNSEAKAVLKQTNLKRSATTTVPAILNQEKVYIIHKLPVPKLHQTPFFRNESALTL
jgi:hypothetical protein